MSKIFLNGASEDLESLKEKELTFDELQLELRKIVTFLTAGISEGKNIDVGLKRADLISVGIAYKNSKNISENDVKNYISRISTKI